MTAKKQRGRVRVFPEFKVQGQLNAEDADYFQKEMERTDRPMAWVLRSLVSEAITARKARAK